MHTVLLASSGLGACVKSVHRHMVMLASHAPGDCTNSTHSSSSAAAARRRRSSALNTSWYACIAS